MMLSISEVADKTKDAIKSIPANPIENLGFLFPVAMCCVSIVGALVSCILFAVQGGYSAQISLIKQSGISGISEGFTAGNSAILTSGIVGKIVLALLACELVFTIVACFIAAGKAKRVGLIVDLVIMGIVVALFFVVTEYHFSDQQAKAILESLAKLGISFETLQITYLAVVLASIIAFFVLTVTSKCRWMLGHSCLSISFSFILAPLIVILLENLIPLVLGLITVVVLWKIVGFMIIIFSSDDEKVEVLRSERDGSAYKCTFIDGKITKVRKTK